MYLNKFGWYRLDPRGNKEGVESDFTPPIEKLAFNTSERLETDIQGIWPEPLQMVIKTLQQYKTYQSVYENLPDLEVYPLNVD